MSLQRLSGPAAEPVSLDEVKLFCRVDTDAEDDNFGVLISAARALFERETGLVLMAEDWEWTFDRWPVPDSHGQRMLSLPLAPVSAITEIVVRDGAGGEVDIPPTDYVADLAGARIVEAKAALWPRPRAAAVGVRIAFTAGFGTGAGDVPAAIRQALLELIATLYEQRGLAESELDLGASRIAALFAPFRRARL
jgi:uncharacterized phiE125 gp8 family phage protein